MGKIGNKRAGIFVMIAALFLSTLGLGEDAMKSMTLEDCLVRALEKNLNLQVQVLNPELADLSVSLANEKFLPSLGFQYNTQNLKSPSYSWIDAVDEVLTKYNEYAAQINQLFPTGAKFSVSLFSYINDTNRKFQTINPRYGSTLQFDLSQPLLKDFGLKVNRREIIIAQNNRDIAENDFKKALLETIYTVEEAYWNLVYNIENLKVKKQSLELAKDLLAKNKREVEIGMVAPIEVLSAEAEVASREADILQAEVLVKNSEDQLKTLLNIKEKEPDEYRSIVPSDIPSVDKKEVTLENALAQAMDNRPELQAARLNLKNKDVELTYSRNQLLPGLSLQASYWSPGISGTQILYAENDPLTGIVVGEVPGRASDALKDAFNFKHKNWALGLTFSFPLNSVFSRALSAQAKVNLEQAKLSLEDKEQKVFLEVRNAVREVETNYKRVEAYEVAKNLAEKKLEAEEKKLKVGLSTNYLVLQNQRDLANAQGAELKARIDLMVSLANLEKATGTSIQKRNIKWVDLLEKK